MAQNSAVLVRNTGARGEEGASQEEAKNDAVVADGNVALEAEGGRIDAIAGRPPIEDAETTKMKAKLLDVLPGVPPEKIDTLVKEVKDKLGAYSIGDLKEIDLEDLDKINSIVGVAKKKFNAFVKEGR